MNKRITDQQWGDYPCGDLADDANGKPDAVTEARMNGWRGTGDWLDLSAYRDCGYVAGCVVLLAAIVIMSAFTCGLWIGETWRK